MSRLLALAVLLFGFALSRVDAQTLPNGGSISAQLTYPNQVLIFPFSAAAGENGLLTIVASTGITFEIRRPSGAVLVTDLQLTSFKYQVLSLPDSGTYQLRVRGYSASALGSMTIHFAKARGAAEFGELETESAVRTLGNGNIDSYVFSATQGQRILLNFGRLLTETSYLYLYDPDGVALGNTTTGYDFIAQKTGPYTVLATRTTLASTWYALHLAKIFGANEHGLMANSGNRSESLTEGDLDSYTFKGSVGGSAQFSITGSTVIHTAVYGPTGALVAQKATSFGPNLNINSLPQDGVYTVVVKTNFLFQTASYAFTFNLPNITTSYSALGDSYSSGEGVFPFVGSFGFFSACNRSLLAYSRQVRLPLSPLPISLAPNSTYDFYACTGAVTENIRASGTGQYAEPPQVISSQSANRDLITITVGGNDSYFAPILAFCLAHKSCHKFAPFAPYLDMPLVDIFPFWAMVVESRLVPTFQELRASAPNATVVALGYPLVVGGAECPAAAVPFLPDNKLSAEEQKWMRKANQELNGAVRNAAARAGVHFVSVEERFEGHGVCGAGDDWIFGTRHFWPQGLFHPTARGQREYARAVNRYLETVKFGWPAGYFPTGLPRNPAPVPGGPPWNFPIPEFAKLSVTLSTPPTGCVSVNDLVAPGQSVLISGSGFAANETVQLEIHSAGTPLSLGSATANASGVLSATRTLSTSLPLSTIALIEARAGGQQGLGIVAVDEVKVVSSLTLDGDGDTVPNGCDNCPALWNAPQTDSDHDGRGDVCDTCPLESVDDEDGDALCSPIDTCPFDSLNDIDNDSVCAEVDNCPAVANPQQEDIDGDGKGNACDALRCFPVTATAYPAEGGEIQMSAGGCASGGFYEGETVRLFPQPAPGYVFAGWIGTVAGDVETLNIVVDGPEKVLALFQAP